MQQTGLSLQLGFYTNLVITGDDTRRSYFMCNNLSLGFHGLFLVDDTR